jgi:hypothetical protein
MVNVGLRGKQASDKTVLLEIFRLTMRIIPVSRYRILG